MSKMKPEIRFGGLTDVWEQRKLGEITNSIDTGRSKFVSNSDGKYEILGSTSVIGYDDKYDYEGDFLLTARVGANAGQLYRHSGRVKISDNTVFVQGGNLNFIFYMLMNSDIKKLSFGTGQPLIKASELRELELMLPKSNEEQEKIGAFFNRLHNLITLQQRKLDKIKKLKSAYLSKMFPKEGEKYPRLRFAGFTDVWEQRKLGDLGKTFTGLSGKTKNDFGHGDAEFVTYMNVFSNPISNTDQTENVEIDDRQNEVEYGDIFFTTSSETPEEVGMSSVWLGNKPNVYLNSFCFGYRPTEKLDPYYMAYMLRSPEVRKKFLFLAQGISRYNISKTKVMDLFVPIPKIEEQMVIGKFLNNLDNLVNLHQRELEKLKQFKQAMLQKMFV